MIRLQRVSKGYRHYLRPADRLREFLWRTPLHQVQWALHEVDFSVERGETFGVIGENGAGKSTLLKLIAGTSRPSGGRVEVNGQVAALLELGIGFHSEESGRDNVYLMGALAGVPPKRMARYYAEIAEFSELPEEVLRRPVKTYSSGMFMRLAFATATAVDPDILVIDEALSVGDMHFQKKSLNRIMAFRERGKTVLFCAHNMYQVRSLCRRAVWLQQGRMSALGDTEQVVTAYESYLREKQIRSGEQAAPAFNYQPAISALAPARIAEITLSGAGELGARFETFQPLSIGVAVECDGQTLYHIGVALVRNDRENVFGTATHFEPQAQPLSGGRRVSLHFPELALLSGDYWLSVYILDDSGLQVYDSAEKVCPFTVYNPQRQFGIVHMPYRWEL